jgi:hypothetical protein
MYREAPATRRVGPQEPSSRPSEILDDSGLGSYGAAALFAEPVS